MYRIVKYLSLAFLLIVSGCNIDNSEEKKVGDILINFDKYDLVELERFVDRFHQGKGDYLLAIPPIIDGGYWVYDLYTDGSTVNIIIDATRDHYSDGSKREYVCGNIEKKREVIDGVNFIDFVVQDCSGDEELDEVVLFRLSEYELKGT